MDFSTIVAEAIQHANLTSAAERVDFGLNGKEASVFFPFELTNKHKANTWRKPE